MGGGRGHWGEWEVWFAGGEHRWLVAASPPVSHKPAAAWAARSQ